MICARANYTTWATKCTHPMDFCTFVGLWKIYSCLFIPNCTWNHVITCTYRCLSPTFHKKKLIFHFEIKSPTLQNYKVSKYKFAPALALKWYPWGSTGSHWPSEVVWHLYSQSESGRQMHLQLSHFSFGPQEGRVLQRVVCHLAHVLVIIIINIQAYYMKISMLLQYLKSRKCLVSKEKLIHSSNIRIKWNGFKVEFFKFWWVLPLRCTWETQC